MTRRVNELKDRLDAIMGIKKAEQKPDVDTAFWNMVHTGKVQNALKENSDGSGGYLVPDSYDSQLVDALREENFLRRISRVIKTEHTLRIPVTDTTGEAQWIDEEHPFQVSDVTFDRVTLGAYKAGTMIKVSEELLEDGMVDIQEYLKKEFVRRFADKEEETFLRGNGLNKPLGLIYQATIAESKRPVLDFDTVFDLYYDLPHQYRDHAAFLCSEHAYRELHKIKTAMGQNMWVDSDMLLGRPIYTTKYLDDAVPGGLPILFGDFSYFWIGERGKTTLRRLNERYADKGQIGFQMHERVDAKLIRPEAMCCLKIKEESA
ncbi:MAG: phage major capsid protein [Clostridia bacterium]|nr:phage major capsid protein [Clostridia bacterium]